MKSSEIHIVIATGNAGKLREFRQLLDPVAGVTVDGAESVGGMPEVDESAEDFAGNARLKALALMPHVPSGSWVLADDSGLEVEALGGLPGVRSARFAGEPVSHAANNAELLRRLREVPEGKRRARFCCVLALAVSTHKIEYFSGICAGHILTAPKGEHGFGYDPLFQPVGYNQSFAEMSAADKNRISHRGRALRALAEYLA